MKKILVEIGVLLSYIYNFSAYTCLCSIKKYIYTGLFKRHFCAFGEGSIINPSFLLLVGPQYISIGKNCYLGSRVQLTAWDKVNGVSFSPYIEIGDGSSIGDESHVSCINRIIIGKGVRSGKRILITDNSHGNSSFEELDISPSLRPMVSKGQIIIEDNVWIGEKATIVANVKIGRGSIVAANSVVTKDVPPYCVVAGSPAKIVKVLYEIQNCNM